MERCKKVGGNHGQNKRGGCGKEDQKRQGDKGIRNTGHKFLDNPTGLIYGELFI
jgi:hypothetical protein